MTVVHDYLTQRGGAERVVLEVLRAFPGSVLHTAMWDREHTYPDFADHDVRVTVLDRVGPLRADHRRALPVLAPAFSALRPAPADVVLCSSSGWAHGVRTGRTPKVVYCHTPARWLHGTGGAGALLGDAAGPAQRAAVALVRRPLLGWDRAAARSATRYLANSTVVRERVRAAYGRDAQVLHPPPGLLPDGPEQQPPGVAPGAFLVVARLLAYKHVGVVVDAVRALPGARLVVVGEGPLRSRLVAEAPAAVTFLSGISDAELRWLYRHCAALVTAAHEDFGLTPLEAGAFGRPVVALGAAGHLDTVRDGTTGLLVDAPDPAAFTAALRAVQARSWDPAVLQQHAAGFGRERFAAGLRRVVDEVAGA